MEYKDKVAIVTGGAHGIGKCIAEELRKKGASVAVIDMREGDHFVGDVSKKEVLEAFADEVIGKYGKVDYIVNNALPLMKGLDECTWEEFQYALSVGVTAKEYGIQSVPTLMLFRHGEVLWRTNGVVQRAELLATIDSFLR